MKRYKVKWQTFYSDFSIHEGFMCSRGWVIVEADNINEAIKNVEKLLTDFCGDKIIILEVKIEN